VVGSRRALRNQQLQAVQRAVVRRHMEGGEPLLPRLGPLRHGGGGGVDVKWPGCPAYATCNVQQYSVVIVVIEVAWSMCVQV
jgi:hypothetical protein